MKKKTLKLLTLVLLFSFMASPAIGQTASNEAVKQPPPEDLGAATRPEPELLPQEILNKFEGGMTVEEFLLNNQGPIPNALLEYADIPVVVIVQLEQPTLIEYMKREGLEREDTVPQNAYLEQVEDTQSAILNQITAVRSDEISMVGEPFKKVLNGFMLRVPASAINDIREIDGVKSVTKAPEYELTLANSVPLINGDDVWTHGKGFTGKDVSIAVIDTGIDYTHAMLGGSGDPEDYANNDPTILEPDTFPTMKVIGGYDFAGTDYDAGDAENDVPVPDEDPLDEYGHGTHVASIAAGFDVGYGSGVAPDALLYAVKIFGESGSTNLTLHAIEWAMDPKGLGNLSDPVDVINMSLGSDWGPADETDPEFVAVENASAIGVVVVSSAGNAGDSSYIVGSPSSGDSAISVAASTTGFQTSPYIEYAVDTETYYIPYTTSYNPFTTTITADLVDVATFDVSEVPGELCDITGLETPLTGDIALIKRGNCSFAQKINNAEALGAVAAVIYNNVAGIISMDTTGSTLPAGSILQSDGVTLKGLAPIAIYIGPDSNVRTFVSADPPDTIATFSSRGPRGFDSKLKPEITAPGVAIFAADMGSGDLGVSMGGTSMAAPHVAGVAALMKEAKTDWSSWQIKSAMMNTSVDLADPISAQVPRQGAGRVDALEAIKTNVVAYGDPKLISLSWGVIEITEDYEDTQIITLQNLNDHPVNLDIDSFFTSDDTGALISTASKKVTLPSNQMREVEVTLSLDASMLPIGFGDMEEYYGYVTFDGKDDHLRVPFYFVPRPYTTLTEVDAVTEFDVSAFGYVDLEQSGPVPSSLWPYPVSLTSENAPDVLDGGDLRYVGMDYGWYDDDLGDIFVPAFAMWGDVHTNQPFFNEVDLYIDANRDGAPEAVNFNYNYGWFSGGQDNTWVVVQIDYTDGNIYLGSPYTIYADFNSGFQEWYLPAAYNYVVDEFDYQVASFDWNGMMDFGGMASFDISKPPLSWWLLDGTWTDLLFDPQNEMVSLIVEVLDLEGFEFSDIAGVMLVDYHGQPGTGQSYFWPLKVKGISHLQVAHLAPFAEDASVTITIDGAPRLQDFDYGDSTQYIPIPAGEHEIAVIPTGSTEPAIEATINIMEGAFYTTLAVGDGVNQDLDLLLLEDDLTPPEAGKFHLRLGHLAPFTAGGATADIRLQDGTPILENVDFGDVTGFLPLDAGTYDLKITTPGGDMTLIDPLPVTFAEGDIVSAFATGEGINQPLGVYALPVDEFGSFLELFVGKEAFMYYLPLIMNH